MNLLSNQQALPPLPPLVDSSGFYGQTINYCAYKSNYIIYAQLENAHLCKIDDIYKAVTRSLQGTTRLKMIISSFSSLFSISVLPGTLPSSALKMKKFSRFEAVEAEGIKFVPSKARF